MKKALAIVFCVALLAAFGFVLYSSFSDRTVIGTVVEVSKTKTFVGGPVTLISVSDDRGEIHTVGFYNHVDHLSVGDKVEITYTRSDRVAMQTVRREIEDVNGTKRIETIHTNFWTIKKYKITSRH